MVTASVLVYAVGLFLWVFSVAVTAHHVGTFAARVARRAVRRSRSTSGGGQ